MPITEGKQRASRIPLDYYKHPDPLVRWKRLLAWGLSGLTVVWIASALLGGDKGILGQRRFSHGAVAVAHKPIEHDCAACHASFGLLAGKESVDAKCQTCHLESPRDFHHDQKESMTPNCGRCHSDHHGLDFNLVRTTDRDCIVCHKNLPGSTDKSQLDYMAKISSFSDDHPEFKLLRDKEPDPGKLKFNHKYHMTEGIVLAKGGKVITVGDIVSGEQQSRFGNSRKKTDAVKLECANCHETETRTEPSKDDWPNPDQDRKGWEEAVRKYYAAKQDARGRLPSGELLPPRKTGKYMKPINYDNHCAGCHPLNFDPKIDRPVEHGLPLMSAKEQDRTLRKELTRIYEAEYEKAPTSLVTRSPSFLPLPGKRRDVEEPNRSLIPEKVDEAMRSLLAGKRACGECHTDREGNDLTLASTGIAKPDLPVIWLKHARFDHAAHDTRGIDCAVCHKDAYPSTEKDLLDAYASPRKGAEKVLIEGINNCKQCHSSSPKPEFADRGWQAKQDCTECHSYHQGKAGTATAHRPGGGFHAQRTRHLEELLGQPLSPKR
ncbi:MAG: hypothetical protein HYS12_10470 [Planctomycetes bacterium]|nr:hypothetical protein [Planctomycetota bacterium]